MDHYEMIFKRKSVRKYDDTPLDAQTLEQVAAFASTLRPLFKNIHTGFELADTVKGIFSIRAPHYILITSENQEGWLENAGFMWQQMDLYLSSLGLGACWLGMAKPNAELRTSLPLVITLAFGKPAEPVHRTQGEFKRKPASDISSGNDARIEAARLAPSATNSQNWFFEADAGMIHVYRKKLNPALELMYGKMNRIDTGIALCHLYYATEQAGNEFTFTQVSGKSLRGYEYVGTVN